MDQSEDNNREPTQSRDRLATMPPKNNLLMNKKAIIIASLNVRNLGKNSPKQKEIRAWVTSLAMPPQILLL